MERPFLIRNEHGHDDYVFEDAPNMPVCGECHAFKFPNRGQGTSCPSCQDTALREAELDHAARWG